MLAGSCGRLSSRSQTMKSLIVLPLALVGLSVLPRSEAVVAAPAGAWAVDGVHSSVMFKIKHAGAAWFYGTFSQIEGEMNVDADKPENSKVGFKVAAESVSTRNDDRDKHLRGPDFFNAKEHPSITFTSTKVSKKGDGFEVVGDLELCGKKKSVTATVTKTGEGEFRGKRVGFEATMTIKRTDFGMDYGVAKNVLSDEVVVTISAECVEKK